MRFITDLKQISTVAIDRIRRAERTLAATCETAEHCLDAQTESDGVEAPRAFGRSSGLLVTVRHHCDQQVDQNESREENVHREHQPKHQHQIATRLKIRVSKSQTTL